MIEIRFHSNSTMKFLEIDRDESSKQETQNLHQIQQCKIPLSSKATLSVKVLVICQKEYHHKFLSKQ